MSYCVNWSGALGPLRLSRVLGPLLLAVALPLDAAELLVPGGFMFVETNDQLDSFRLRKLLEVNKGFRTGRFQWNEASKAFVLVGNLESDDRYYADIQLWKYFWTGDNAVSESLSIYTGGIDVQSVQFKSPGGVTYTSECLNDGSQFGLNIFNCGFSLPVGQTEFGNGKYAVTYTLGSGKKVKRDFHLSGAYPTALGITYPQDGATNVPVDPLVAWEAVGAARYELIIRDAANQATMLETVLNNSGDTALSYPVPVGALAPNTPYYLTIEALAPLVNGGAKGLKKVVGFTTAP